MTLNEKVVNYKILDLVILYNFGIKFDLIRDYMKKLWIFLYGTICRGGPCYHPRAGWWHDPPLQMPPFLGAGDAMNYPWKWRPFLGAGERVIRP